MTNAPAALRILLVDDDADIRRTLGEHLRDRGHQVLLAEDGAKALELLEREEVDIAITDVRMPVMDGFELLARLRSRWPDIEVVMVTAYGDIDSAVRALREGAFDFFTKPLNVYDITASLERTARFQSLQRENERYRERLDRLEAIGRQTFGLDAMIGQSPAILAVKEQIAQVSASPGTSVLIEGETGTGKELVARAIHYESERVEGPFVAVDCSAVPSTLVEAEFYGHARGAFTDAREERKGYFEMADGGTLFLDEVGDMDRDTQARLLRTLEERRVRRLGSSREIPVDLLVDDDALSARALRDALSDHGHVVRLVGDGRQALAQARQHRPDLVISDIEMPSMDGLELLMELKRLMEEVPVILVTAAGGARETAAAFQHGADGFLQKPVVLDSLLAGIARLEADPR